MKDGIKRKWGDAKDGRLIRGKELDTNHYVMPIVWPKRTDNEAFINEKIDLTKVNEYLLKINEGRQDKISLFTLFLCACGKLILNRPHLNRFYRNGRLYERYRVSIGFIVKKSLSDDGAEALARVYIEPNDTLETVAAKVNKEIEFCRSEAIDQSSKDLVVLMKFPHFVGRIVLGFMKWVDRHFAVPESVSASDLFFNSLVVSHLGSIKLHASYHHLSNWGTNSFFIVLGEKKLRPFINHKGDVDYKDSIDMGLTIDERIADGFYYSKSIRLFKKYLDNPECLEQPLKDE